MDTTDSGRLRTVRPAGAAWACLHAALARLRSADRASGVVPLRQNAVFVRSAGIRPPSGWSNGSAMGASIADWSLAIAWSPRDPTRTETWMGRLSNLRIKQRGERRKLTTPDTDIWVRASTSWEGTNGRGMNLLCSAGDLSRSADPVTKEGLGF